MRLSTRFMIYKNLKPLEIFIQNTHLKHPFYFVSLVFPFVTK